LPSVRPVGLVLVQLSHGALCFLGSLPLFPAERLRCFDQLPHASVNAHPQLLHLEVVEERHPYGHHGSRRGEPARGIIHRLAQPEEEEHDDEQDDGDGDGHGVFGGLAGGYPFA